MSFGLQIKTTAGTLNVANFRSCRLVDVGTIVGATGTYSSPNYDSNKGFFRLAGQNGPIKRFTWNNTTKILTKENYFSSSTDNYTIYFYAIG